MAENTSERIAALEVKLETASKNIDALRSENAVIKTKISKYESYVIGAKWALLVLAGFGSIIMFFFDRFDIIWSRR